MEAQAMFVLSGHFIGYLPNHYAARWVTTGELVALLPSEVAIRSDFFIVTREREHRSALLRTFVQEIIAKRLATLHAEEKSRPATDLTLERS